MLHQTCLLSGSTHLLGPTHICPGWNAGRYFDIGRFSRTTGTCGGVYPHAPCCMWCTGVSCALLISTFTWVFSFRHRFVNLWCSLWDAVRTQRDLFTCYACKKWNCDVVPSDVCMCLCRRTTATMEFRFTCVCLAMKDTINVESVAHWFGTYSKTSCCQKVCLLWYTILQQCGVSTAILWEVAHVSPNKFKITFVKRTQSIVLSH